MFSCSVVTIDRKITPGSIYSATTSKYLDSILKIQKRKLVRVILYFQPQTSVKEKCSEYKILTVKPTDNRFMK